MKHEKYGVYIRASTQDQSHDHQRDDIEQWLSTNDIELDNVTFYQEYASGAAEQRDEFEHLIENIENEHHSDIVVWEISRIARKGFLAQRFFDACEDAGVTIHVTNGSVRRIESDGTGRLLADIIASVAAEERRTLIRRTMSGQRRARSEGKWIGKPPKGFLVDNGYLKPNLNPQYDAGETGFFDMVDAIENIDAGESYSSTAESTPNVTRQTLATIDQDESRRSWYLDLEADNDKISNAIRSLDTDS